MSSFNCVSSHFAALIRIHLTCTVAFCYYESCISSFLFIKAFCQALRAVLEAEDFFSLPSAAALRSLSLRVALSSL